MKTEVRNNKVLITGKTSGTINSSITNFELPTRRPPVITNNGNVTHMEVGKIIPGQSTIGLNWLPFAAEQYKISPNIKDYVFAYVPALTSDIPNRNLQGFSLKTLLEFDVNQGCQRYKTFIGKGLYVEHDNKNPVKASGVILDASIIPVPKYKVAKVMLLVACDRTKNPSVAGKILTNGGSFSMGCLAPALQCSICGGVLGPSVQFRTCTCYHTDWVDMKDYGKIYNGMLHYLLALEPTYIEISHVGSPADITALGDNL